MLPALLFSALALSCSTGEPVDPCSDYEGDAWAVCERGQRGLDGDVEASCGGLLTQESACREEWARLRVPGLTPTEELLAACGSSSTCLLLVTDMRAPGDPVERTTLCASLPPDVADDCLHHALREWATMQPTQEEADRLGEALLPSQFGPYLAMAVQCSGLGSCPESGQLGTACQREQASLAEDPERCRVESGTVLVPGKGPPPAPKSQPQLGG